MSGHAKVPQHLEIDDVVAFGLGATDLICVALAIGAAWCVASALPGAFALRLALAALVLVGGAAFGLVRVGDRDLRRWTLVIARFALRARVLRSGGARCV